MMPSRMREFCLAIALLKLAPQQRVKISRDDIESGQMTRVVVLGNFETDEFEVRVEGERQLPAPTEPTGDIIDAEFREVGSGESNPLVRR